MSSKTQMIQDDFTIHPKSNDVLVYDEHDGRTIEFAYRDDVQPPIVRIPALDAWLARTPAWAHERRQQIVERLRQAGTIIYEQGVSFTSVLSPDRTFRVECESEPDDRGPAMETTSVLLSDSGQRIVYLPMYGFDGSIEFPAPGLLTMMMHGRCGERFELRVNVATRTYRLDPDEPEQPLASLPDRLGLTAKHVIAMPAITVAPPGARQQIWNAFIAFIGLIFVAGGAWVSFAGKTAKDRLAGIVGVFLFGAAAFYAIRDLGRQGSAGRRQRLAGLQSGTRQRWRVAPYLPLMVVGLELLWIVFVFAMFIFMVGDSKYQSKPQQGRLMSAVLGLPAVAGVMLGVVAIVFRWAVTTVEWICLILGCVVCGLFAAGFVWGAFH
ncbi:MAG TPA: hypothetical protein VH370_14695 [Humisphaera sp.]|jgi:hypothetical protein|nr:hypothetical protein [Humisphaera sp.]